MDEPSASDFAALAEEVKAVKKYAPGKLAYINLFPNYATSSQLGAKTYVAYLNKYVKIVHPQFLSYDNYMVQYSSNLKDRKGAANYYKNLLAVRRVALQNDLPYWIIVASMQVRDYVTSPSPANLRLQAYIPLAAGFDGISWYTYSPNWDYSYDVHSPIDGKGQKTKTWRTIKKINGQVLALAPLMNRLTSTGVYFTSSTTIESLPKLPGKIIKSVQNNEPLMIGEFTDGNEHSYVMFVNLNLEQSVEFTFTSQKAIKEVWIISAGKRKNVRGRKKNIMSTKNEGEHHERKKITLKPGAGKLIELVQ
jgi:hypothetical protein